MRFSVDSGIIDEKFLREEGKRWKPCEKKLSENGKTYVEPDISVICDSSKLDERGCHGTPDWVLEIVSPASRKMDYYKKLFRYRTAGVREYWVVDPERQIVTVYHFEQDNMEEYSFGTDVPVGIYPGFSVRVP